MIAILRTVLVLSIFIYNILSFRAIEEPKATVSSVAAIARRRRNLLLNTRFVISTLWASFHNEKSSAYCVISNIKLKISRHEITVMSR